MLLVLAVAAQGPVRRALSAPVMQSWMTVFVAVVVQALPFLVLGVLLSALIAVLVPPSFLARALPRRPALAVPVAGAAGAVLPGCECASVPVAGALVRRGVAPAAALAFLLSAPAINPIVLTATAVAFPGEPRTVLARSVASLLVACVMGWLWQRVGRADWLRPPARPALDGQGKGAAFWGSVRHDVMHAGGFLVVGAIAAATLKAMVPARWLRTAADDPVVSILALAVLAVLLSICSEADAFVAASLSQSIRRRSCRGMPNSPASATRSPPLARRAPRRQPPAQRASLCARILSKEWKGLDETLVAYWAFTVPCLMSLSRSHRAQRNLAIGARAKGLRGPRRLPAG